MRISAWGFFQIAVKNKTRKNIFPHSCVCDIFSTFSNVLYNSTDDLIWFIGNWTNLDFINCSIEL